MKNAISGALLAGSVAAAENLGDGVKLNPVEAETTGLNESDSFLPVVREADLSTGPP